MNDECITYVTYDVICYCKICARYVRFIDLEVLQQMVAKLLETHGVRHAQWHVRNAAAHALLKVVEGSGTKAAHFLYIVGRFIPGIEYSTHSRFQCSVSRA